MRRLWRLIGLLHRGYLVLTDRNSSGGIVSSCCPDLEVWDRSNCYQPEVLAVGCPRLESFDLGARRRLIKLSVMGPQVTRPVVGC